MSLMLVLIYSTVEDGVMRVSAAECIGAQHEIVGSEWVIFGDGPGDYFALEACEWYFEAVDGVSPLTITLATYSIECRWDALLIYDDFGRDASVIFRASDGVVAVGDREAVHTIVAPGPRVRLVLRTDTGVELAGFEAAVVASPCPMDCKGLPASTSAASISRELSVLPQVQRGVCTTLEDAFPGSSAAVVSGSFALCECDDGFAGIGCHVPTLCVGDGLSGTATGDDVPCNGRGVCVRTADGEVALALGAIAYVCDCDDGWTGLFCEVRNVVFDGSSANVSFERAVVPFVASVPVMGAGAFFPNTDVWHQSTQAYGVTVDWRGFDAFQMQSTSGQFPSGDERGIIQGNVSSESVFLGLDRFGDGSAVNLETGILYVFGGARDFDTFGDLDYGDTFLAVDLSSIGVSMRSGASSLPSDGFVRQFFGEGVVVLAHAAGDGVTAPVGRVFPVVEFIPDCGSVPSDGCVFMGLGSRSTGGSDLLDDTWLFDVGNGTWARLDSGPLPRMGAASVFVPNVGGDDGADAVYVHGGFLNATQTMDLWKWHVSNFSWTEVAEMTFDEGGPVRVWAHSMVLIGPDLIMTNYGRTSFSFQQDRTASRTTYYVPSANVWLFANPEVQVPVASAQTTVVKPYVYNAASGTTVSRSAQSALVFSHEVLLHGGARSSSSGGACTPLGAYTIRTDSFDFVPLSVGPIPVAGVGSEDFVAQDVFNIEFGSVLSIPSSVLGISSGSGDVRDVLVIAGGKRSHGLRSFGSISTSIEVILPRVCESFRDITSCLANDCGWAVLPQGALIDTSVPSETYGKCMPGSFDGPDIVPSTIMAEGANQDQDFLISAVTIESGTGDLATQGGVDMNAMEFANAVMEAIEGLAEVNETLHDYAVVGWVIPTSLETDPCISRGSTCTECALMSDCIWLVLNDASMSGFPGKCHRRHTTGGHRLLLLGGAFSAVSTAEEEFSFEGDVASYVMLPQMCAASYTAAIRNDTDYSVALCASRTTCLQCQSDEGCGYCSSSNSIPCVPSGAACDDGSLAGDSLQRCFTTSCTVGICGSCVENPNCFAFEGTPGTAVCVNFDISQVTMQIETVGECPAVCVADDCASCTGQTGCLWCEQTQSCLTSALFASLTTSSGGCSDWVSQNRGQCDAELYEDDCSTLTDCESCQLAAGCGWCLRREQVEGSCVAGDLSGAFDNQCNVSDTGVLDYVFLEDDVCRFLCAWHDSCASCLDGGCAYCQDTTLDVRCTELTDEHSSASVLRNFVENSIDATLYVPDILLMDGTSSCEIEEVDSSFLPSGFEESVVSGWVYGSFANVCDLECRLASRTSCLECVMEVGCSWCHSLAVCFAESEISLVSGFDEAASSNTVCPVEFAVGFCDPSPIQYAVDGRDDNVVRPVYC